MALFHEAAQIVVLQSQKHPKRGGGVPVLKDTQRKEAVYKQGVASGHSAPLPLIHSRNNLRRTH